MGGGGARRALGYVIAITGWFPLLLTANLLLGQSTSVLTFPLQIAGHATTYRVSFTYTYQFSGGSEATLGSIILPQPTEGHIQFGDFSVEGADSTTEAKFAARIKLPSQLSGSTVFLNSKLPSGRSNAFAIDAEGPLSAPAVLSLSYNGMRRQQIAIELGKTFTFQAVEETPVKKTGAVPVPDRDTVAEVDIPESDPTPEPPLKPAYELDYESMSPERFIEKWPDEKRFVHRALARIPIRPQVVETSTNVYELTFERVRALQLDSVSGGVNYEIRENGAMDGYGHRLVVAVADTGIYRLHLSDTTKEDYSAIVELDNLIGGEFYSEGDTVLFQFRGGNPPYRLLFTRHGTPLVDREIGMDTSWRISQAALRDIVGSPGEYGVHLLDERRAVSWNFGNQKLMVARPNKTWVDRYGLYIFGGALLLLLVLLSIRGTRRRKRRSIIRENLSGNRTSSNPALSVPAFTPNRKAAIESSRYPDSQRKIYTGPSLAGKFRITRRPRRNAADALFNPDERPKDFLGLALEEHWSQTAISTIFFEERAIRDLDEFLRRENTSKIVDPRTTTSDADWEQNKPIPEIGGMLMGQYRTEGARGMFRVSVEKFVPLQARVQNVVKVEIDPMSLARDLSLAQDENTELTVVGWFHTHPGHGLFLSQPDLKVQYGHFRSGYHFAMEIDSLTERLDTAFFTYRPDGTMNNINTKQPETEWFSWAEIAGFSLRNTIR